MHGNECTCINPTKRIYGQSPFHPWFPASQVLPQGQPMIPALQSTPLLPTHLSLLLSPSLVSRISFFETQIGPVVLHCSQDMRKCKLLCPAFGPFRQAP